MMLIEETTSWWGGVGYICQKSYVHKTSGTSNIYLLPLPVVLALSHRRRKGQQDETLTLNFHTSTLHKRKKIKQIYYHKQRTHYIRMVNSLYSYINCTKFWWNRLSRQCRFALVHRVSGKDTICIIEDTSQRHETL